MTDLLNKSFGVASYNRKLSKKHKKIENPVKMQPIVDFTTETSKEQEWDNIACVHRDTTVATTWSYKKQKMGDLKLRHPRYELFIKWIINICLYNAFQKFFCKCLCMKQELLLIGIVSAKGIG